MLACAAPNGKNVIRIQSESHPALEVGLDDLSVKPQEANASATLVRGVAAHFGEAVLREVPEADFRAALPSLRVCCGDRAVFRALHFYDDDRRAVQEAQALKKWDFSRYLCVLFVGISASSAP